MVRSLIDGAQTAPLGATIRASVRPVKLFRTDGARNAPIRYNVLMDEAKFRAVLDDYAATADTILVVLARHGVSSAGNTGAFYRALDNPLCIQAYQRARMLKAHTLAEQSVEITDTDADPQRARNRAHSRQWLAAKLNRQAYGEQLDVQVGGSIDLTEARQRALQRPVRDQLDITDAQIIDYKARSLVLAPGLTPVTLLGRDATSMQEESHDADSIDPFA